MVVICRQKTTSTLALKINVDKLYWWLHDVQAKTSHEMLSMMSEHPLSQVVWLVPMETLIEAKLVNLETSMSSLCCNQQHVLKKGEHSDTKVLCQKCVTPWLFKNETVTCIYLFELVPCVSWNSHSSLQYCLWSYHITIFANVEMKVNKYNRAIKAAIKKS